MDYRKHFSTTKTDQREKIPGMDQEQNNAGGFAWKVDDWARLERFLVLGTESGTYYVSEQKLTVDNAKAVLRCIKADGSKAIETILEISDEGRAPKNDPALFVLAMACSFGDDATKQKAFAVLPKIARIGTHLFHFLNYVEGFRGWGRGLRNAVAAWYNGKPIEQLIYQVIKYRQRDGWSHRDALRLSHPKSVINEYNWIYKWITQGEFAEMRDDPPFDRILAFERAQKTEDPKEIVKLIALYDLPREAIPTQHLAAPVVWDALFDAGMPMTAMIRNLGNLTKLGILKPLGQRTAVVIETLTDVERLRKARVHPLALLIAQKIYASGVGMRGSGTWEPVGEIVDALDQAFYLAFQTIEPTSKRIVLALDVSGSMSCGNIAGTPITPREGSAAMALVTKAVEPTSTIMMFSDAFIPVPITGRERLDDVVRKISGLRFGGTDCALPMLWALEKGVEADAFVIYTDSETWYGDIHPCQALVQYRRKIGIPAKLVVVGMTSSEFSIADPNDGGMLDLVGFDTAAPRVIADFIRR